MGLWEQDNKPSVNKQVDRVWIQEMKSKLQETFGN
jgi:hypothetical protein